jgi:peptide/nickel transport system permease protein
MTGKGCKMATTSRIQLGELTKRIHLPKRFYVGAGIITVFVVMAIFAPWLTPYGPEQVAGPFLAAPSLQHWLGTDNLGHDVMSQIMYGARVSLWVGFTVAVAVTLIGTVVGLLAGFYRGATDEALMRMTDVMLVLPALPLAITLAAYLGPSETTIIEVLTVTSWPLVARIVRSQTLSLRERPFTDAARIIGSSNKRIMYKVMIPNLITLVAANAVLAITGAVVGEAGLDFIGLGNPSIVSWGTMLYWAQNLGAVIDGDWWWILAPGLCIALVGLGAVLMSVSIENTFNPRLRSR